MTFQSYRNFTNFSDKHDRYTFVWQVVAPGEERQTMAEETEINTDYSK